MFCMLKTACDVVQVSAVFGAEYIFNHEHVQKPHCFLSCTAENLWNAIHHGRRRDSEQGLWNHAIRTLGMRWNVTTGSSELCDVQTGWKGYGPLASIVFPQTVFCRRCCTAEHTNEYYLIHHNARHLNVDLKHKKLKKINSWFLLDHWKGSVNSSLEGNSWLISIYNT